MAGEANKELTVSALACHIGGPNSVNPGHVLRYRRCLEVRNNKSLKNNIIGVNKYVTSDSQEIGDFNQETFSSETAVGIDDSVQHSVAKFRLQSCYRRSGK